LLWPPILAETFEARAERAIAAGFPGRAGRHRGSIFPDGDQLNFFAR
jgi:hypothetical protein